MSADTPRSQLEALSLQYTKQQEGAKPPSAPPYQQCRHPAILPASCSDTSQTLPTAQSLCRGKAPSLTKNPYFFFSLPPTTELQANVAARQKLEAQFQENTSVRAEFDLLSEGSKVFKLVGPVLMRQEKSEAIVAVDGRLGFIENEMYAF